MCNKVYLVGVDGHALEGLETPVSAHLIAQNPGVGCSEPVSSPARDKNGNIEFLYSCEARVCESTVLWLPLMGQKHR